MVEGNQKPANKGDDVVSKGKSEASGNANLDLVSLHRDSLSRDRIDITKNTQAMSDDRTSVQDAHAVMNVNNQVIRELLDHGQVSAKTLEQAARLHTKANADDKTDARESQEYSGTNPPDAKAVENGLKQAANIGDLSSRLSKATTPEERQSIISQMGTSAQQIADLGKGDPAVIGKDASDAGKEAAVIQGNLAKLGTLDPSSPLYKQLIKDIGSKAGLIQREFGDIKDEQGYIAHDAADTSKNNAVLDAIQKMQQHSGRMDWNTAESFIKTFQQDNQSKREIIGLRRDDLKSEPDYNTADRKDARLNAQILKGLDESPYPKKGEK
ncbi:MAG TPA: hypothetical protein V6D22_10000 [Candidatus Obscuribacterales bacterium]